MTVLQLSELIPMITPLGKGYAIVLEVTAHEYYWTIAMDNGTIVTFAQDKIRIDRSYTHSRNISDKEMREIINKSYPQGNNRK